MHTKYLKVVFINQIYFQDWNQNQNLDKLI